MTPEPIFLSVAEVLAIHKNQVELYGGLPPAKSRKNI
jgi:hypothetical protein